MIGHHRPSFSKQYAAYFRKKPLLYECKLPWDEYVWSKILNSSGYFEGHYNDGWIERWLDEICPFGIKLTLINIRWQIHEKLQEEFFKACWSCNVEAYVDLNKTYSNISTQNPILTNFSFFPPDLPWVWNLEHSLQLTAMGYNQKTDAFFFPHSPNRKSPESLRLCGFRHKECYKEKEMWCTFLGGSQEIISPKGIGVTGCWASGISHGFFLSGCLPVMALCNTALGKAAAYSDMLDSTTELRAANTYENNKTHIHILHQ